MDVWIASQVSISETQVGFQAITLLSNKYSDKLRMTSFECKENLNCCNVMLMMVKYLISTDSLTIYGYGHMNSSKCYDIQAGPQPWDFCRGANISSAIQKFHLSAISPQGIFKNSEFLLGATIYTHYYPYISEIHCTCLISTALCLVTHL